MKKQKMTIKEIVDTIPARLGLDASQLDLSTPEKAYDFLTDSEFQIFSQNGGSDHVLDGSSCGTIILETGYKAMYDVNALFNDPGEKKSEMEAKYDVYDAWVYDMSVVDETGYVEDGYWLEEELYRIKEDNWPYRIGFNCYQNVSKFIKLVQKICIVNNDWAKITICFNYEEHELSVSENGQLIYDFEYTISDDNGSNLVYGIVMLLDALFCDTFEEVDFCVPNIFVEDCEEKSVIPTDCALFYNFLHKEELAKETDISKAIELIRRYPRLIKSFPIKIQMNKDVAIAFIEANDPYEKEARAILSDWRIGRHMHLSGGASRGDIAYLKLNGIISPHGLNVYDDSIDEDVLVSWCNDKDVFEKIIDSSMAGWVSLTNDLFEEIDHNRFLKSYPRYIYTLRNYFEHRVQEDEKLAEHIKRRFGLLNDADAHDIAVMATYEMIMDTDPQLIARLVDSYDSFILAPYVVDLLLTVPKAMRDDIIKTNIKMAYYISDELENDEEIVDYICEYCPKAGDILSDEIVIKRNLKRTTLNPDDICEDCDLC